MVRTATACPSDDEIAEYIDHDARADAIAEHVVDCEECNVLLRTILNMILEIGERS